MNADIQPNGLAEAGHIVSLFYSALKSGENTLEDVPGLMLRIINEGFWKKRQLRDGSVAEWDNFQSFVEGKPLAGLGESMALIKRLCRDDPAALDAIDKACQRGPGNPTPSGNNQHTRDKVKGENQSSYQGDEGNPKRDRSTQFIRRLRKDFPDLHQRVLAKKMKVNEAAVEAGIAPRRVSVNLSDADSAARTLAKADKAFLRELHRKIGDVIQ